MQLDPSPMPCTCRAHVEFPMSLLETTAPQPADGSASTLWSSVREALHGSQQDYTIGSLNRSIFLLAIPMVLEMVLESLFAVTDVFWVGRLGANAVATVGLTESMLALVFAIGLGLALSTTAMVARRIGEKDPEDAAVAGVQAIVLGLVISLAIGIPAGIYAPHLLQLMGASPAIVAGGSGYAHRSGRVRRDHHAVPQQCDFPWGGRRGHRHATAMGLEHHQSDPRPVPDFWYRPFPAHGRYWRSPGDLHRAQHRRGLPVLSSAEGIRAHSSAAPAGAYQPGGDDPAAARFAHRYSAIRYRQRELDLSGAHRIVVRFCFGGRLHRGDSHRGVLCPPVVGVEQCRRDPGWPEPGRGPTGPCQPGGLAYRLLQHGVPGYHRNLLHRLCHAAGAAVR